MPFQEVVAKQFIVRQPSTEDGKPGAEIVRIAASEEEKLLVLHFNKQISFKEFRVGMKFLPIHAKMLGEGLIRAAELADAAWKEQPPT